MKMINFVEILNLNAFKRLFIEITFLKLEIYRK